MKCAKNNKASVMLSANQGFQILFKVKILKMRQFEGRIKGMMISYSVDQRFHACNVRVDR